MFFPKYAAYMTLFLVASLAAPFPEPDRKATIVARGNGVTWGSGENSIDKRVADTWEAGDVVNRDTSVTWGSGERSIDKRVTNSWEAGDVTTDSD